MKKNDLKKISKILQASSKKGLDFEMLEVFLTHTELEQILLRYEIIKSLVLNLESQRDLSTRLKISISKITRGSNELKRSDKKTINFLTNYMKEHQND